MTTTPYRRIYRPDHPLAGSDGLVYEHRMVVFDAGIEIPEGHQVHHKNSDPRDNRLENLEVVSPSQHQLDHHTAPGQTIRNQFGEWPVGTGPNRERLAYKAALGERTCERCGGTIPERKRADAQFCSKRCQVGAWKRAHRSSSVGDGGNGVPRRVAVPSEVRHGKA